MKALLRKELREFLPIGIIGFAATTLLCLIYSQIPNHPGHSSLDGFFSALRILSGGEGPSSSGLPVPIVNPDFEGLLSILCIIFGATLGSLLAWRETSGKTWAYLIHRPVTRGAIMRAKLSAGLIIYIVALGIPLTALSLWCSIPGSCPAPWSWLYLYSVVDKLIIGILYLSGLFLCYVRTDARWYGSRSLPAFAVIIVSILQNAWTSIISLFLVTAAMELLLLAAIHYAFVRRTPTGRFALVSILSIGLTAFLMLVLLIFMAIIFPVLDALCPPTPDDTHEWPHISADGEFQFSVEEWYSNRRYMTDLEGNILCDNLSYHDPVRHGMVSFYLKPSTEARWTPLSRLPATSIFSSEESKFATGYIYRPDRILMIYDWRLRMPVRFLGKGEASDATADVTPFTYIFEAEHEETSWRGSPFKSELYVCSADGLYVDSAMYGMLQVCSGAVSACEIQKKQPPFTNTVLYARGEHFIQVSGLLGEDALRFPLPPATAACDELKMRILPDRTLGVIAENRFGGLRAAYPELQDLQFLIVTTNGSILRKADFNHPKEETTNPSDYMPLAVMSICPGATVLTMSAIVLDNARLEMKNMLLDIKRDLLLMPLKTQLPVCIAYWLLCTALAFIMLQRRGFSMKLKIWWTLFTLLGGLPALLSLRIVYMNERAVPCPSCGRKRQPSRMVCPKCKAQWPHPQARDIDLLSET